jgi:hypothetical protein
MDSKTIGEITESNTNKTVFSLSSYKGKDRIDVRDFFKTTTGSWLPTKRGVTFKIENASELVSIFEKIEDTINKK